MTFVHPMALWLLVPAGVLLAWRWLGGGRTGLRLPGHWRRVIDAAMRSFMAQRVKSDSRLPVAFWTSLWTLLVVGLAEPTLDSGAPAAYGNLAGRVLAVDLGAGEDVVEQRLLAYRILDASPETPTALVAASAESFDVVPLTTDRAQLDRYLQVLDAELMPVSGRAVGIAIVHSEQLLERAGVIVGQTVLLTGGLAPPADSAKAGAWLRALVVARPHPPGWETYAEHTGAQFVNGESLSEVLEALDDEVADVIRDADRSGDFPLGYWLVAVATVLWILFFRRLRSA